MSNDPFKNDVPQSPIRVLPTARPVADPTDQRVISWERSASRIQTRLIWFVVLALCIALVAVAWRLQPDVRGHSTHEQLGLTPCGFYLSTGLPCPTCGATTAFTWVIHGHPWQGIRVQPFGAAAAFGVAALLGMSVVGIVTGGVPAIRLSRRSSFGLALGIMSLIVGSWVYKLVAMMVAP